MGVHYGNRPTGNDRMVPKLLNHYYGSDAAAAYSLRNLDYLKRNDPVVRVRRASDNEERDFTAAEVLADLETWANSGDPTAPTGGTISVITDPNDGKQYRVHTFTSDGTFETPVDLEVEYLIVGGGGGGGAYRGGGGGGGALAIGTKTVGVQTYNVEIGAGGSGAPDPSTKGSDGSSSSIFSLIIPGGGGGGSHDNVNGRSGGSGGGASGRGTTGATGGNAVGPNTFPGGTYIGTATRVSGGGGGGGASEAGTDGTDGTAGNGGDGILSSISGNPTFYSSGGGGGRGGTRSNDGLGGPGAGDGAVGENIAGESATGFGSGGGGGGQWADQTPGGDGGSGIVIIRYELGNVNADAFVTTWYDQSGNDNHATQTTATNQPKIVDAGTLVTENGKAAVDFDGVNDYFDRITTSLDLRSFITVAGSAGNEGGQGQVFGSLSGGGVGDLSFGSFTSAFTNESIYYFIGPSSSVALATDYNLQNNEQFLNFTIFDENNSAIFVNSNSANLIGSQNTVFTLDYQIGKRTIREEYFGKYIQEIIFYPSDQSANRIAIESNINSYYDIY